MFEVYFTTRYGRDEFRREFDSYHEAHEYIINRASEYQLDSSAYYIQEKNQ